MSISSPGRQKITASLTELLSIKSLSSIKVTELVRTSSVSHQTFSRYFMDKYDAAEYACYECLSVARTVVGPNSTVKDQTICLLNIVKSHSSFFKHLLADPDGATIIRNTLIKLSTESINFRSSPPITNAWLYCLQEWNGNNYTLPVEEVYLKVISCYPIGEVVFGEELKYFLEKYGSYTMSELNASCNAKRQKDARNK